MQLPRLHANEARKPASGFNCYVLFRFSLRFEWQKPPSTLLGPSNERSCPLPNLHKKEKKTASHFRPPRPTHPPNTHTHRRQQQECTTLTCGATATAIQLGNMKYTPSIHVRHGAKDNLFNTLCASSNIQL